MARRRLTPARIGFAAPHRTGEDAAPATDDAAQERFARETGAPKSPPPIARVAGEASGEAALRRVVAGGFSLDKAISLTDLEAASDAERDARLLPVDSLLSDLPRVDLPEALANRFSRGQAVTLAELPQGGCSVYAGGGRLLGLGEGGEHGALRPRRLVNYASG